MNILATYSGLAVTGALVNQALGVTIPFTGVSNAGLQSIQIRMSTVQTVMKVGMDGAVVPTVVAGDNGEIEMQVWQTSTIDAALLNLYNLLKAARDGGDVSSWAANTLALYHGGDGSAHYCTGVGFQKIPDRHYETEAQPIPWLFVAANATTVKL